MVACCVNERHPLAWTVKISPIGIIHAENLEDRSMLTCEETTRVWGMNHPKELEGTVL